MGTSELVERLRRYYPVVVVKPCDNVCAVHRLMYTVAILSECCDYGYEDRWCYEDLRAATVALERWSGLPGTEPAGWHRHPATGRRREGGDPSKEYVNR